MFLGHTSSWEQITADYQAQKLPNAYLFVGIDGIGKKIVAKDFVKYIFCQSKITKNNQNFPCESCPSCKRVADNQHPDFFLIEPDGASIKIDSFRELKPKLFKAPLEASYKVILIDSANKMTVQAANSILKFLEEPPPQTLFILLTPNLSLILPTIRSRSRLVAFMPPTHEEAFSVVKSLSDLTDEQITNSINLSGHSISLALELLDEKTNEPLTKASQLMRKKKASFHEIVTSSKAIVDEAENPETILEMLKQELFNEAKTQKQWHLTDHVDLITKAQRDMKRNINKQLILENLFLKLCETN